MLKSRINRRAILHGAITLTGALTAVQLGSVKKTQANHTSSSQRKGILLAVDLQNGFLTSPECKAIVPKVVANANQFYQVWATRFFNRNPNFSRQVNWNEMVSGQETELDTTLTPVISKTFEKPSYSPPSELIQALQSDTITTVAVCGIDTDACVMAAVLEVFDAGIETFVVSDGCASSGGQEYHESAIKLLKRNIGAQYVVSFSELPAMLAYNHDS